MNWDAIAAISEFVAAIAVVISLIYLAVQVRSGSKTFKTSLRDSTLISLMEWNYSMLAEKDLAWIFQQGARDFDSLDEKDRARATHVFYSFFKLFENIYLHYLDKSVDEEIWLRNRQMLFAYASQPGARYYFNSRMPVFDPRFQELLRTMEAAEISPGYEVSKLGDPSSGEGVK